MYNLQEQLISKSFFSSRNSYAFKSIYCDFLNVILTHKKANLFFVTKISSFFLPIKGGMQTNFFVGISNDSKVFI